MKRSFLNRASALMLSVLMFVNTSASTVLAATGGEDAPSDVIERIQELDDAVREQTVPLGTKLYELNLPKTIRAVVVDHSFYETDKAYEVYNAIAPTGDETKDRRADASDEEEETEKETKAAKPEEAGEETKSAKAEKDGNVTESRKADKEVTEAADKAEKETKAETAKSGDAVEAIEADNRSEKKAEIGKETGAAKAADTNEAGKSDKAEKDANAETEKSGDAAEISEAENRSAKEANTDDAGKSDKAEKDVNAETEKSGDAAEDIEEDNKSAKEAEKGNNNGSAKEAETEKETESAKDADTESESAAAKETDAAAETISENASESETKAEDVTDKEKEERQKEAEEKEAEKKKEEAKKAEAKKNAYWDQDELNEYFDGLLDGSISSSEAPKGMKLRPVTVRWNIDPDQSVSDVYDPEVPGTYVFRAEVKSSRLVPGDGAEMPEITVTVDDGSIPFHKTVRHIGGESGPVNVTVDAEAGVIPAGTTLNVRPIRGKAAKKTVRGSVEEGVSRYAEEQYIELPEIEKLYSFEVLLTDRDGETVTPDTSEGELRVSVEPVNMDGVAEGESSYHVFRIDPSELGLSDAEENDGLSDPEQKQGAISDEENEMPAENDALSAGATKAEDDAEDDTEDRSEPETAEKAPIRDEAREGIVGSVKDGFDRIGDAVVRPVTDAVNDIFPESSDYPEAEMIPEDDAETDEENKTVSFRTEETGVFAAVRISREEAQSTEFNKHITIDGVRIQVSAPAGVFPAGSSLKAVKVADYRKKTIDRVLRDTIGENDAAEEENDETGNEEKPSLVRSYVFDLTILDKDGNEIQPDTSNGEVSVRFSRLDMTTIKKGEERIAVFHLGEEKDAEMLPAAVDTAQKSVEVKADHFSEFAVAFMTAVENGLSHEFEIHSEENAGSGEAENTVPDDARINYVIRDVKAKLISESETGTDGENVSVEFGVKVLPEDGDPEIVEVKDGSFTLPAATTDFTVIARAVTDETAAENQTFSVSFGLGIDSVRIGNDDCTARYESKSGDEDYRADVAAELNSDHSENMSASLRWEKSDVRVEVKYLCEGEEIPAEDLENISYEIADRLEDGILDKENAPKIYKYDFDGAVLRMDGEEIPVVAVSRTGYRAESAAESSALTGDAVLVLNYNKKEEITYTVQLSLYPQNMNVTVPFRVTGFAEGESAQVDGFSVTGDGEADSTQEGYSFGNGALSFRVNLETPKTLTIKTYSDSKELKLSVDNDAAEAEGFRYQALGSELEKALDDASETMEYTVQMPSQEGVLLDMRWNDNNNPKTNLTLPKLKLQYRIQGENDDDAWKDVEEDGNGDCYFDAGAGSRRGLDLLNAEILTAEHPLSDSGIGLQKSNNMSWEYKFVQKLYGYFYDDINGSGQIRKVEYRLAVDGENAYLTLEDGRKLYYTSRFETNKDRTENNQILVHTLKSDYRAVAEWGDNGDKYGTRPELDHFPEGTVLTRTLDRTTVEGTLDENGIAVFEDETAIQIKHERTEDGEDVITLPDAPGFDANNHPYVYTLKFPELAEEDKLIGSRAVSRFDLKSADGLKLFKNVSGAYYGVYCENTDESNDSMNEKELYSGGKLHLALTGKTSFTMNYVWNDANKYNDENNGNRRPKYQGVLYRYIDAEGKSFQTASPVPNVDAVSLANDSAANEIQNIRVPEDGSGTELKYLNAFDENGNPYVYFLKLATTSAGTLDAGDSFKLDRHAGKREVNRNSDEDGESSENGWFDAKSGSNFIYNGNELHLVLTGTTDVTVTEKWIDAARADKKSYVTLKLQRKKLVDSSYQDDGDYNSGNGVLTEVLGPFNAETKSITSSKFTGLSRYDENGKEYKYYAVEEEIRFEEDGDQPAAVISENDKQYVVSNTGYRYRHTVSNDGKLITNELVGDAEVYITKRLPNGVLPYAADGQDTKKLDTVITFTVYRDGVEIGTVDYKAEYREDGSGNPVESRMFTGDPAYRDKTEYEAPADPSSGDNAAARVYRVDYDEKLLVDSYEKLTTRKNRIPSEGALPRYDGAGRQYHYTVSETAVKLTDGTNVMDLYHLDYSNTAGEGTGEAVVTGTDIHEKYSLDKAVFTNTKKVTGKASYTVTNRWIDGGDSMYHKTVNFALQYSADGKKNWKTVDKGSIQPNQQYVRRSLPDKATVGGEEIDLQAAWKTGKDSHFRVVETGIGYDSETDSTNVNYHYYTKDSMAQEEADRKNSYPEYYLDGNKAGEMDFAVTPDQNYAVLPVAERNAAYDGGTYDFALMNRRIGLLYIDLTNNWVDGSDHQGARPVTIVYHVNGNGESAVPMEVKAEGEYTGDVWHYRSEALPKYSVSDGEIFHYNVRADHVTTEKDGTTAEIAVTGGSFTTKTNDGRDLTYSNQTEEDKSSYKIGAHHTGDVQNVTVDNVLTETFSLSVNKYWMDLGDAETVNRRPDIYMKVYRKYYDSKLGKDVTESAGYFDNDWVMKSSHWWVNTFKNVPRYSAAGDEYTYYFVEQFQDAAGDYEIVGAFSGEPTTDDNGFAIDGEKRLPQVDLSGNGEENLQTAAVFDSEKKISSTIVNRPVKDRTIYGKKIWNLPKETVALSEVHLPTITIVLTRAEYQGTDAAGRVSYGPYEPCTEKYDENRNLISNMVDSHVEPMFVELTSKKDSYSFGPIPAYDRNGRLYRYQVIELSRLYKLDGVNAEEGGTNGAFAARSSEWPVLLSDERRAQADMVGKLYKEGDGTISEKTNSIALTNTYDPPLNYRITAEKNWEGFDRLTAVQKSKPVSVKFVLYRSVGMGMDGTALTYDTAKTWLKAAEQTVMLNPEDFSGLAEAGYRSEITFDQLPYYGPDGAPYIYKIAEEDPDTTKKVVGTAYAVLTETEQDGQKTTVKNAKNTVPIVNVKAPDANADGTDATASGNGSGTAALINHYSNDLTLTVKKEWKDGAAEKTGTDHMPGEIHVTVYRTADGYEPETVANLTLTKEHGWTVSGEAAAEGSAAETDSRLSGLPKYAPDGAVYTYHAAENLSEDQERAFHIPADAEDAAEAENIGKLALPDEWSGVYTKRHVSGDVYRADGATAQTDTVLTLNNEFRLATVTLSGKKLTDQAGTELTAEQIAFADRFRGIPEELTFRIAYTTDDLSDDSKKASAVWKVLTEDTASGAGYPVERKMTLSRTDWKYYGDGADRTKTSLTMTGLPRFIPVDGEYREAHYRFFEYAMAYPDGAGGVAAPILRSGVNADGTVEGLLAETAIGSVTSGFGEESSFASAEDNGFYSDSTTDSANCVNRIPMRSLEICKEWDDQFDRDGVRPQKMTFRIAQGDDNAENSSDYKDVQLTGDNVSTKAAGDENANIWRSTKTENGDLPSYSLPVYREGTSKAASYRIREDVSGDGAASYTRHQVKRNEGAYTDQTEIALPAYTDTEQSASAGEVKGDTVWFRNGRDADTIKLSARKLWRFAGKDYDGTDSAVPAALKDYFAGNLPKMIFSLQYREAGTGDWKDVVQDEDGTKKTGFTGNTARSVSPAVLESGALSTSDPDGLMWLQVPVHADDHDLAVTPAFEFRLRESVKLGADAFTAKEVFSDPVSAAEVRKEQEKAEDDAAYKLTVTNEFKSASLSVKKTWDDQENRYGTRPAAVLYEIQVKEDGQTARALTAAELETFGFAGTIVTEDGISLARGEKDADYAIQLSGLPEISPAGKELRYRAVERKLLYAAEGDTASGQEIPVGTQNGESIYYTEASDAGDPADRFAEKKTVNGKTVLEQELRNTLSSVALTGTKIWKGGALTDDWNFGKTITSVTYGVQSRAGEDSDWKDVKTSGTSGETLLQKTAAHTGTEDSVSWSGEDALPMFDTDGNRVEYRIREISYRLNDGTEVSANRETPEVNGETESAERARIGNYVITSDADTESVKADDGSFRSTLTNTAISAPLAIRKIWEDQDDLDQLRPDHVTVTVKAAVTKSGADDYETISIPASAVSAVAAASDDGRITVKNGEITLTLTAADAAEDGSWTRTLMGLPVYDLNGNKIRYTVSEPETIEKYTASGKVFYGTDRKKPEKGNGYFALAELNEAGEGAAPTTVVFTNNHGQNVVEIHVEKRWEGDGENLLGDRPLQVKARLYASWTGADGNLTEPAPAVDTNGVTVEPVILTGENGWKGGWTEAIPLKKRVGNDLTSAGTPIIYSVREEVADNVCIDPETGGYVPEKTDTGNAGSYSYGVGVLQAEDGNYVLTNRMKTSGIRVTKMWTDENSENRTDAEKFRYGNIDRTKGLASASLMLQRTADTGLVPGSAGWENADWKDVPLKADTDGDGTILLARSSTETEESKTIGSVVVRTVSGPERVTVEFSGLPMADADGDTYLYRVREYETSGYEPHVSYPESDGVSIGQGEETALENGFMRGDLTVTKVWEDDHDRYGTRPKKLKITVIPKIGADADGNGGEEIAIDGLNAKKTGVRDAGFESASLWAGLFGANAEDGEFLLDSTSADESGDKWSYTWKNLPAKTPDGETITYVVSESGAEGDSLAGYQAVDADGSPSDHLQQAVRCLNADGSGPENAAVTFTNRLKTTSFKVTKVWEDGYDDPTGVNRHVKSVLAVLQKQEEGSDEWQTVKSGSTEKAEEISLLPDEDAARNWSHTWTKLPTHTADGKALRYRAVEAGLELTRQKNDGANLIAEAGTLTDQGSLNPYRYRTTYDEEDTGAQSEGAKAGTIANRLITGSITATKVWDDDRDRDGIRPDAVTLHLIREAGGRSEQLPAAFDRRLEDQKARGEGDWTSVSWENLPVRDADGTEFRYTVKEEADEMPGYVPYQKLDALFAGEVKEPAAFALTADGETQLTIINRHIPAETKVEIRKQWNTIFHGARPDYAEFELTAHWTEDGAERSEAVRDGALKESDDDGDHYWFHVGEGDEERDQKTVWSRTIEKLPAFRQGLSGVPVTYEITERPVEGYKTSYEKKASSAVTSSDIRKMTQDADGRTIIPVQLTAVNTPDTTDLTISVDWDNEIPVIARSIDKVVFRLQRRHAGSDESWQYVWVTDEKSSKPVEFEAEMPKVLGASRRAEVRVDGLPLYDPGYETFLFFAPRGGSKLQNSMFEYRAVEDRMVLNNRAEVRLRNYEEGDFVGSYQAVGKDGSELKEGSVLGVRRYRSDWKNTSHAVKIALSKKWTDEAGKTEIGTDSVDVTISASAQNTAVDLEELTRTVTLSKENGWSAVMENLPDETVEGYPVTYTIRESGRSNYKATYEVSEAAQMQEGMPHSGDGSAAKFITGDNVEVTFINSRVLNGGGSGTGGSGSGGKHSGGSGKRSSGIPEGPAKEIEEKIQTEGKIITETLMPEPMVEKAIRQSDEETKDSLSAVANGIPSDSWRTNHRTPGTHQVPRTGDDRQMKREAATAALAIFGLTGWTIYRKRFERKD
ncbi:MAG: Cna B-type domain-containing protein [Bacillota bacterium]|nr:Cna B-type domain-containing protein [Bacillota bacterium]